jgi:hypothetical protein
VDLGIGLVNDFDAAACREQPDAGEGHQSRPLGTDYDESRSAPPVQGVSLGTQAGTAFTYAS